MKVFNLACDHNHRFEGWFSAAEDFDQQLKVGLVECPICASKAITKMLSAPRLNLSGHADSRVEPAAEPAAPDSGAQWLQAARHLIKNSEDVGERFSDEARRIHYREAPNRNIRGVASREQAAELADEGIEVLSFMMPAALKEPLQ